MRSAITGNVQRLIKSKGWTLYRLSKVSGVSMNSVYNLGNRAKGPATNTIVKIAVALGTSVDELLKEPDGEEVPHDDSRFNRSDPR